MEVKAITMGNAPGMAHALIAGIAVANDLHIITRNRKHFLPFGVPVSSPEMIGVN